MKTSILLRRVLSVMMVFCLMLPLLANMALAKEDPSDSNRFNVVVVLDASGSMQDTDPDEHRYVAIKQFITLLAEKGNVLGGLVFHTDVKAEKAPAEVNDQAGKNAVMEMLESIPSTNGWTNTGAALERAVQMVDQCNDNGLPSVILYLSDGNTELSTDEEIQASLDRKAEALQKAREQGTQIYSVCLNADKSADISEMRQLADATGGVFQEVVDAKDLQEVFNSFYNLIFGTSTVPLVDATYPANGRLETGFDIPGLGVEEVNIIIYGNATKTELIRPDGTAGSASGDGAADGSALTMLKLTDLVPGRWTLVTEGVPGDSIKINMVYNTNLRVETSVKDDLTSAYDQDTVTVMANLYGNGKLASSAEEYTGYQAKLQIQDAYGEVIETVDMALADDHFEVNRTFAEGIYYFKTLVDGNHVSRESETIGPLQVVVTPPEPEPAPPEPPKNNPPTAVNDKVEATVNIWPFKGGEYTLDLKTLATDQEDSTLRYKIVSSSFIENTDYTVSSDDILKMDHFSLSKGSYTISATDSFGESCQIEVVIKTVNIGLLTVIGLGIIALIVAAILITGIVILANKKFRGTILAQSCTNGIYKGNSRNPKMGKCKLAVFGMDPVGLDYQKSYFQATSDKYIWLYTDKEVTCNGRRGKKFKIISGTTVTINVTDDGSKMLYIQFTSRMR